MRLSDIKGDKAFEVLADLLTPIGSIAADDDIKNAMDELLGGTYMKAMQLALRTHPKDVKAIIAILDLKDPDEYEVTLATLPKKFLEIVNDPDVKDLFTSQGQEESKSSGSASENTKVSEK